MTYPHTSVKIVADSISDAGHRLTTFLLVYPRFIHAEFMTHRMFSRNAQSTRAIPTAKRISQVIQNPVTPIRWGANQKGMQAKDCEVENIRACRDEWDHISKECAEASRILTEQGLHKQWAGRMIEAFDTITVICTATNYENFFGLRCAPDAQPEINDLAWKMAHSYYASEPRPLAADQWHLPFIDANVYAAAEEFCGEHWGAMTAVLRKISAARCARVSYLNHDGSDPDIQKDIDLHDMLVSSGHMTPLEHQATPITQADTRQSYNLQGNFRGWKQYRKMIPEEQRGFNYELAKKEEGRE